MTFNELWNELLSEMPRKQRIRITILSAVERMKIELLYLVRKSKQIIKRG